MEHTASRAARLWGPTLVILVAVRIIVPLVVLAAEGHELPSVPRYDYGPLYGDANGYYSGLREFQAAAGRVSPLPMGLLLVLSGLVMWAAVTGRRRWSAWITPWVAFVALTASSSLGVTLVILEMDQSGSAVIGWPAVWAAAQLPFRAVGLVPTPDVAFGFGLALSLAANAVSVVATAYLGYFVTSRRGVGLGAAALLAISPLLVGVLTGGSSSRNGMWMVDTGLALYTEPLSTALVLCAVVIALRSRGSPLALAGAGSLLSFATVVKLSNGSILLVVLVAIGLQVGLRATVPFVLAAAVWVPVLVAYWPLGYVGIYHGWDAASTRLWGVDYVADAWLRSTLLTPLVLVLIVPAALVGFIVIRDAYARALIGGTIAATVLPYSFYEYTAMHPRFLYVALPFVFVLEAAAAARVVTVLRSDESRCEACAGSLDQTSD
jgi:hypothetical protein